MEPLQHTIIPTSSAAVPAHPLTSSNLPSNMLCPISTPQLGEEVVIIKNFQQLEDIPAKLTESCISSSIAPTPVRLSGDIRAAVGAR